MTNHPNRRRYHGAEIIRTASTCLNNGRALYKIKFETWEKSAEHCPLITSRRAAEQFIDQQPETCQRMGWNV